MAFLPDCFCRCSLTDRPFAFCSRRSHRKRLRELQTVCLAAAQQERIFVERSCCWCLECGSRRCNRIERDGWRQLRRFERGSCSWRNRLNEERYVLRSSVETTTGQSGVRVARSYWINLSELCPVDPLTVDQHLPFELQMYVFGRTAGAQQAQFRQEVPRHHELCRFHAGSPVSAQIHHHYAWVELLQQGQDLWHQPKHGRKRVFDRPTCSSLCSNSAKLQCYVQEPGP